MMEDAMTKRLPSFFDIAPFPINSDFDKESLEVQEAIQWFFECGGKGAVDLDGWMFVRVSKVETVNSSPKFSRDVWEYACKKGYIVHSGTSYFLDSTLYATFRNIF